MFERLPYETLFCIDGEEVGTCFPTRPSSVWMVGKSGGGGRTGPLPVSVFSHEWCSQVRAEGSGVVSRDCGKVSDTRGPRKDPVLANWSQNFTPWA